MKSPQRPNAWQKTAQVAGGEGTIVQDATCKQNPQNKVQEADKHDALARALRRNLQRRKASLSNR